MVQKTLNLSSQSKPQRQQASTWLNEHNLHERPDTQHEWAVQRNQAKSLLNTILVNNLGGDATVRRGANSWYARMSISLEDN